MKSELNNILKTLPKGFFILVGAGIFSLSVGSAIFLIRSSNISFDNGQTSLIVDAKERKKLSDDIIYANEVLQTKVQELENDIEWLKWAYDKDGSLQPILESIDGSVRELEPIAREIDKSSEQLKKLSAEVDSDSSAGNKE